MLGKVALLLVVCCCSAAVLGAGIPAGVGFTLGSNGLEAALKQPVLDALAGLKNTNIPDVPQTKFDCGGNCYFSASSIVVHSVTCSQVSFSFSSTGVASSIGGCNVSGSGNWRLHRSTFPNFSCSGGLNIALNTLGINGNVQISASPDGHLVLGPATVATSLGGDDLGFSGDCKLLADAAKSLIKKAVKEAINKQLGSQISQIVDQQLAKYKIPTSHAVGPLTVDMRIAAPPKTSSSALSIQASGIVSMQGVAPYSGVCSPLPVDQAPSGGMVQVNVADCVFDSAMNAAYGTGMIQGSIQQNLLGMQMTLGFSASAPPTMKITPQNILLVVAAKMFINVTQNQDSLELDVVVELPATVGITSGRIVPQLQNLTLDSGEITIKVVNGTWNPFTPDQIKALIQGIGNNLFVPTVNSVLIKGMPIPAIPRVTLSNTRLSNGNGYLVATTDLQVAVSNDSGEAATAHRSDSALETILRVPAPALVRQRRRIRSPNY